MYPAPFARQHPDAPAIIMASSGETLTYGELEKRSNRLAHLLRSRGIKRLDHYSIFMENHLRYAECCCAGERTGLYYTCINSFLTADEVAYIVNNSESRVLIFSQAKRETALAVLGQCPKVEFAVVVDGPGDGDRIVNLDQATAGLPDTPVADETLGTAMLYSSGTTGRPKGILRPLPEQSPAQQLPVFDFLQATWQFHDSPIYLSPAPLYHSAPLGALTLCIRSGGTTIIMERFDAEQFLALTDKYKPTHTQMVPTMFSRLLKLPEAIRRKYDVSSYKIAIHGAAPCPPQVKQQMIEWWGPVLLEYYGATEANGLAICDSAQWLSHYGTVGQIVFGDVHILDDDMKPLPKGTPGTIWFKTASPFEYFNDPEKTAETRSTDGTMTTVGDVGYVDDDNYLYLTDRATFMIISGGVNIYPQECENLLITHPKVADAAVFGVPNEDLGEEVKAVVQAMPGIEAGDELARELMAFCAEHLARQKCPRSVDFEEELPRLPTGKLYKRLLRDRYWGNRTSRIV
ncbi:AMP-binding protein [Chelatococcus reniformis]|uniref:Acyl-CoA synthetase n=1 Tax=Chelatococcus reniformis TaxID=1494448 RepID=A0A916X7W7_9HYPH|nr:AMP-binding protein [Chelatococcus reniformis]GGC52709.1 acyl-CoA synthetase [Chelatococcus reniformis]